MKTSRFHLPSFLGILFFGACATLLFTTAMIFGVSSLTTFIYEDAVNLQTIVGFTTMGFMGTLLATASVISFTRYMNNPSANERGSTSMSSLRVIIGIITTGTIILIGKYTQTNPAINWLVLPFIAILAVTLPLWLMFHLGARDLPGESRWRSWSTFGLSISLTPFLLLILEIVVLIFVFFVIVVIVVANPSLARELETLSNHFMFMDINPEDALRLLTPYLTRPSVIVTVFILFSVIFPMLEEAFKPLGVWLLAGRLTSPAQGFVLGALCGTGFALVESLNVAAQTNEWAGLLFARIGTGAMHITASALVGSGIASAFSEKRYLRLFSAYLFAVLLHGAWNFAAISNSFSTVLNTYEPSDLYQKMATSSGIGLAALAGLIIVILILANRRQSKSSPGDVPATTVHDDGTAS